MTGRIIAAAVLVCLAAAGCAGSPADPPTRPWVATGVQGLTSVCTDQGDRIYSTSGSIAVVPAGCRP